MYIYIYILSLYNISYIYIDYTMLLQHTTGDFPFRHTLRGLVAGEVHQLLRLGAPLHGQDAVVDDGLPELEQDGNPGLDVVHVSHIS